MSQRPVLKKSNGFDSFLSIIFPLLLRSVRPNNKEPPQAIVKSMMVEPARAPIPTATCVGGKRRFCTLHTSHLHTFNFGLISSDEDDS
jgi:hypothetical protein